MNRIGVPVIGLRQTQFLQILALTGQAARGRRCTCRRSVSGLALAIRIALVLLFLPFSALDKVLDFRGAVAQAQEAVSNKTTATALILVGLFVEVFMSAGVVCGVAGSSLRIRARRLLCADGSSLESSFGAPVTFGFQAPARRARCSGIFRKNLALAAGFLLIVFGTDASSVAQFFAHPTIQSHPYQLTQEHGRP